MFEEGQRSRQHYLLEDLSSRLAGNLLCGMGILEGLPVPRAGRGLARGAGLCVWGTGSTSEHTDWISEMSKSDASLPLRLLALLPALLPARLPGRLGVLLASERRQRRVTPISGLPATRAWKLMYLEPQPFLLCWNALRGSENIPSLLNTGREPYSNNTWYGKN